MTDLASASIPDLQAAIDSKTESRAEELRHEKSRLIERLYAIDRELVMLTGIPYNAPGGCGGVEEDDGIVMPAKLSVRARVLAMIEAIGEPCGPIAIGMRCWPELPREKAAEKVSNVLKVLSAEGVVESMAKGLWRIRR